MRFESSFGKISDAFSITVIFNDQKNCNDSNI